MVPARTLAYDGGMDAPPAHAPGLAEDDDRDVIVDEDTTTAPADPGDGTEESESDTEDSEESESDTEDSEESEDTAE